MDGVQFRFIHKVLFDQVGLFKLCNFPAYGSWVSYCDYYRATWWVGVFSWRGIQMHWLACIVPRISITELISWICINNLADIWWPAYDLLIVYSWHPFITMHMFLGFVGQSHGHWNYARSVIISFVSIQSGVEPYIIAQVWPICTMMRQYETRTVWLHSFDSNS